METRINKRMDSQVTAYKALHEGQIHLEDSLKLLMQHAGIKPTPRNDKSGINENGEENENGDTKMEVVQEETELIMDSQQLEDIIEE